MSTDREILLRVINAIGGPEQQLIEALQAAAEHLERNPIPGLEVSDSTRGEWVEAGGDSRKTKRTEGA